MYYLDGKSNEYFRDALNDVYDNYPCMEESHIDFLFVAGFGSVSSKINYIDDLETLQLFILLDAVDRFEIVYRDSNEYTKFLMRLLEEV